MKSENMKTPEKDIPFAKSDIGKKTVRYAFLLLMLMFNSAYGGDDIALKMTTSTTFLPTNASVEATHDFSILNGVPADVFICVDSNVDADIFVGGQREGQTPFCGRIGRGKIVLKAREYKEAKVPVKKESEFKLKKENKFKPHLFAYSLANTASLSGLASIDMTRLSQGRWYSYLPNSYYVELRPSGGKQDVFNEKIREFALKSFFEIKAGTDEYVDALAVMTGMDSEKIKRIVEFHTEPETFARKVSIIRPPKKIR